MTQPALANLLAFALAISASNASFAEGVPQGAGNNPVPAARARDSWTSDDGITPAFNAVSPLRASPAMAVTGYALQSVIVLDRNAGKSLSLESVNGGMQLILGAKF